MPQTSEAVNTMVVSRVHAEARSLPARSRMTLEMFDRMLDELDPDDMQDWVTMSCCALVCRRWGSHIRARKFKTFKLYPGRLSSFQKGRCGHSNAFVEFWNTIRMFPGIGDAVETLIIDGRSCPCCGPTDPLAQPDEGVILSIVQRLPCLRVLDIRNVPRPVPVALPTDPQLHRHFRNSGWMYTPRISLLKLIGSCPPHLRSIRIDKTYFTDEAAPITAWNVSAVPKTSEDWILDVEGPKSLASLRVLEMPKARSLLAWSLLRVAVSASAPLEKLYCTWGQDPWNSIEVLSRAISGVSGTLKTLALVIPVHIEEQGTIQSFSGTLAVYVCLGVAD